MRSIKELLTVISIETRAGERVVLFHPKFMHLIHDDIDICHEMAMKLAWLKEYET